MWIKINGEPLHTSSIKDISKVEIITSDKIIRFFIDRNDNNHSRYNTIDDNDSQKISKVYNYVLENNKSTGNINNYLQKVDGSYDYGHIIKSNFVMDSNKFIFTIVCEIIKYSEGKCYVHAKYIHSKVFDTIEEANEVHNNLLLKLNEIEMSLINIEI